MRGWLRSPWFVFSVAGFIIWAGNWLLTTDFRTSHPRTVPDKLLLRYANNVNVLLYGTKPGYRKIDDPMHETIY